MQADEAPAGTDRCNQLRRIVAKSDPKRKGVRSKCLILPERGGEPAL